MISSYAQRDPQRPKLFEVTRERPVVGECVNRDRVGAHEVHVLTTSGHQALQPPLK